MAFFMWTDQEKTEECHCCHMTIGYTSHGYRHGKSIILCCGCGEKFHEKYFDQVCAYMENLVDEMAKDTPSFKGMKAH